MEHSNLKVTWERYVASWNSYSEGERIQLFKKSLSTENIYTDPMIIAEGFKEFSTYMSEFHKQFPGCYFETNDFFSHHNQSIATWEMKNQSGVVLSKGISHASYNEHALLMTETGFYEAEEKQVIG
jgi:hypothetical protein